MKLFHMYYTSYTATVVGRDLNIEGKKYRIDIFSDSYIKRNPDFINSLELYEDYKLTKYHPINPNPEPIYL